MTKLLIIGKMPPPIGGVSMHVKRLTQRLRQAGFDFDFCETGTTSFAKLLAQIAGHSTIHIHVSNPAVQLSLAIFCRLRRRRLIITYHGAWGRYGALGNIAVKLSARLAYVPIVQERAGLVQALRCNPRAREISTYIADPAIRPLPALLESELAFSRKFYLATFCTNAWNVTFDKYGREIYGISELIDRFGDYPEYQLFISDPSRKYRSYIRRHNRKITSNVLFISCLHDFKNILLLSDAFIRNTTTDGVSLSIQEAHDLGIPVLASAAVERPPFCSVFENFLKTDLKEKLEEARRLITLPAERPDTVKMLIGVYREMERK